MHSCGGGNGGQAKQINKLNKGELVRDLECFRFGVTLMRLVTK